jgi:CHASE2 domain-containing sensor protein
MERLLVLNFGNGNSGLGWPSVIAQLWLENAAQPMQMSGSLPAMPELARSLEQWQQLYLALYQHLGWRRTQPLPSRPSCPEFDLEDADVTHISQAEFENICDRLKLQLNQWLNAEGFQAIQRQIRTYLSPNDGVRIVVTSNDPSLLQLPWHLWQLLEDYPNAEVALSPAESARSPQSINTTPQAQVRILAILGNSQGIDVAPDRRLLEQLPQAQIQWLIEPSSEQLQQQLWEQPWDLLFFAGHSSSQGKGWMQVNATETLTIAQLKYGLKRAIGNGLKLAIFNSCEGLGLAQDLADLHIPQVIVMRQPVPDRVAQAFLTTFLQTFSAGRSLYYAVREAREKLQLIERDFPCATWLPVICQNPAAPTVQWSDWCVPAPTLAPAPKSGGSRGRSRLTKLLQVAVCSLLTTGIVTGAKALGWLQSIELASYDQLIRMRPIEAVDPRLLIVTVTEDDIQSPANQPRSGSLSDQTLDRLLTVLDQAEPRVIGLDIYRDFPTKIPALKERLATDDRLITICKRPDAQDDPNGILPAPEAAPDLVGFSDFVQDRDGAVRRHLVAMAPTSTSHCNPGLAFSTLLTMRYLAEENITPQFHPQQLQIGQRWIQPLWDNAGGYQAQDAQGFQIMLNYRRSAPGIAQTVTLQQILAGQVPAAAIHDRIVLIGVVSPNSSDRWVTPWGAGFGQKQPGVLIQAQMVSQLISHVVDQRPLMRPLPLPPIILWVGFWAIVGGTIGLIKGPRYGWSLLGFALVLLWGSGWWWLIQGWWLPMAMPTLTLMGTTFVVSRSRKLPLFASTDRVLSLK